MQSLCGLHEHDRESQEDSVKPVQEMAVDFIKKLDKRQRYIWKHRITASQDNQQTLQEIGDRFNVSREAIRVCQNRVIRKFYQHMGLWHPGMLSEKPHSGRIQ